MSVTPSPNDLEQLLQLSTQADLVMFSLEYAKGNKDFPKSIESLSFQEVFTQHRNRFRLCQSNGQSLLRDEGHW